MGTRHTLWDLAPGQRAIVERLSAPEDIRRRLRDIGLIQGTSVECVGRSPLGDPAAYAVRGAVMALRRSDADRVEVRL